MGGKRVKCICTWAFDIANDTPSSIVHEFYTYLCDTSTRTYHKMARLLICCKGCISKTPPGHSSLLFLIFVVCLRISCFLGWLAIWSRKGWRRGGKWDLEKWNEYNLPVRPRTLVTLTSLTGTFEESILLRLWERFFWSCGNGQRDEVVVATRVMLIVFFFFFDNCWMPEESA